MKKKLSGILFFAMLFCLMFAATPTKAAEVPSPSPSVTPAILTFKQVFPDDAFRKYVNDNILTTKLTDAAVFTDVAKQELAAYTGKVDVSNQRISDMTGVEYLTGMTELEASGNYLKKLDVSYAVNLTYLNCADNELTELDITKNTELTELYCQYNQIAKLDLSKAIKLERLNIYQNAMLGFDKAAITSSTFNSLTAAKMTITLPVETIGTQCGVILPEGAVAPVTTSLPEDARYLTGSRAIVWGTLTDLPTSFTYEYKMGDADNTIRVTVKLDHSQFVKNMTKVSTPSGLTAASAGSVSVKLAWGKIMGVSGYRIYRSTSANGSYSLVKTVTGDSTLTYTNKSLTSGTKYYYKVRAYRTIEGTNYYSEYSSYASAKPVPGKASITLKKYTKSKKIKVTWKKVSGASGYRVYRATSKNGTYKKVKSITSGTKLTWTNTKLKKKKTYYYKVRAYRKANGKNVFGAYSAIKSKKLS